MCQTKGISSCLVFVASLFLTPASPSAAQSQTVTLYEGARLIGCRHFSCWRAVILPSVGKRRRGPAHESRKHKSLEYFVEVHDFSLKQLHLRDCAAARS